MAKEKIQEKGPMDYRQLQEENLSDAQRYVIEQEAAKRRSMYGQNSVFNFDQQSKVYEDSAQKRLDNDYLNKKWYQSDNNDWFGHSMWDNPNELYYGDKEDLIDKRAENQWGIAQLGAGAAKMLGTAASTFLNNTMGVVFGLGEMAVDDENRKGVLGRSSYLYHNMVTDGLADFNKSMETWLPNYKTQEQQENSWYQNLGTMNFWADSILKNIGFTVGSAASMFVGLGAIGKVAKFSSPAMRIASSIYGAVTESMFEANNTLRDWKDVAYQEAADANGVEVDVFKEHPDFESVREGIDEASYKVGILDMGINIPILTASNFMFIGKIFSKGWSGAVKDSMSKTANKYLQREAGVFGKYFTKEGLSASKEAWKETGKTMVSEGLEEMAQGFAADLSGELWKPDNPNTFYDIEKNNKFDIEAKNLVDTSINSFANRFMNIDNWEEFVAGAVTAMIGAPTFGRANNQQAQTYIGQGKKVGISGGLFGNLAEAKEQITEAKEAETILNKYNNKLRDADRYFAKTMAYSDKMDRFRNEDNKFEYKNNEDNMDFEAISFYNKYNKLDDLIDIANQSFENLNEQDLCNIAKSTTDVDLETGKIRGWKDKAGNSLFKEDDNGNMSMSEENQALMKKSLEEKRKLTLKKIEDYKDALFLVDNIKDFNSSDLSDHQREELAWLMWKQVQFKDRLNSIADKNRDNFLQVKKGLQEMKEILSDRKSKAKPQDTKTTKNKDGVEEIVVDEEGENTKYLKDLDKKINLVEGYIDDLDSLIAHKFEKFSKSTNSKDFYKNTELQEEAAKVIENYGSHLDSVSDILGDVNKLCSLKADFKEKTDEYIKNAEKIKQERQKKEKVQKDKEDKLNETVDNSTLREKAKTYTNNELAKIQRTSSDEFEKIKASSKGDRDLDKLVDTAEKINKKYYDVLKYLNQLREEGKINQTVYNKLYNKLQEDIEVAESPDQLFDKDSFLYSDDEGVADLGDDISEDKKEAILADMKSAMDAVKERMETVEKALGDIPKEYWDSQKQEVPDEVFAAEADRLAEKEKTVGHDETNTVVSFGEKKEKNKKLEQEKKKQDAEKGLKSQIVKTISGDLAEHLNNVVKNRVDGQNFQSKHFEGLVGNTYDLHEADNNITNEELIKKSNIFLDKNPDIVEAIANIFREDSVDIKPELSKLSGNILDHIKEELSKAEDKTPVSSDAISVSSSDLADEDKELENEAGNTEGSLVDSDNGGTIKGTIIDNNVEWVPNIKQVTSSWNGHGDLLPFYKDTAHNQSYPQEVKDIEEKILTYIGPVAFDNAFELKEGDKISFVSDRNLNELVGHIVILLTNDKQGIVGTFPICKKGIHSFTKEQGQLYEAFCKDYETWLEKNQDDNRFTSEYSSSVVRKMIGRIHYSDKEKARYLNEIQAQENTGPIKIAIWDGEKFLTPGNIAGDIMPPLKGIKKGQPVILIPTGCDEKGRKFIARPFITDKFSLEMYNDKDNLFGKNVRDLFRNLKKVSKDTKEIMNWIFDFKGLFYLKDVHLNFDENNNIVLTRTLYGDKSQYTIYKGKQNDINVDDLASAMFGTPIQISKHKLKDRKYNEMVSQIAKINLASFRPVNSWFTYSAIKDGKENKQKSKKKTPSIGFNPNQKTRDSWQTSITYNGKPTTVIFERNYDLVFGKAFNNKIGELDFINEDDFDRLKDQHFVSAYKINKAIAEISLLAKSPNEEGLYQTSVGLFDLKNNEFKPQTIATWSNNEEEGTSANSEAEEDEQEKTINVFYGNNDNPEFSNFASRPFVYNGVQYANVEAAFQAAKLNFLTSKGISKGNAVIREKLESASITGAEAKVLGRSIKSLNKKDWDNNSRQIMQDQIYQSFKQNPDAAKKLLDTGSAIFTHNGRNSKEDVWTKEFPKLLMEVREKLRQEQNSSQEVETDKQQKKSKSKSTLSKKLQDFLDKYEVKKEDCEKIRNEHYNLKSQNKLLDTLKKKVVNGEIKESIDSILQNNLYRVATEENTEKINIKQEVDWLEKTLPQFSRQERLSIVERLIETAEHGVYAYGKFCDGVITISKQAAKGTVFHEAFHAVSQTLLSESEKKTMYSEASKKYGNKAEIELEELLAEDFRRYVEIQEKPASSIIEKIFRFLKNFINRFVGNEVYINSLFYRINRGYFADKTNGLSQNSRRAYSLYKKPEMGLAYNLMLSNDLKTAQNLIDNPFNTDAIRNYHSMKLLYVNLNQEQKDYLEKRGVTNEIYERMTNKEREALFECM